MRSNWNLAERCSHGADRIPASHRTKIPLWGGSAAGNMAHSLRINSPPRKTLESGDVTRARRWIASGLAALITGEPTADSWACFGWCRRLFLPSLSSAAAAAAPGSKFGAAGGGFSGDGKAQSEEREGEAGGNVNWGRRRGGGMCGLPVGGKR